MTFRGGLEQKETMRKIQFAVFATALLFAAMVTSSWATITLNVDSAPNVYGSPNWAPWWTATKADVIAGTFTDMRTGTFPGTHTMDPYDEIVYSTMDLGKRLHWIYNVPDETTTALAGRFEVKWVIDWAGDAWTLEGGNWELDGAEVGWSTPTNWENYDGGVIGSLGFAWWSTDGDAPPFSTDSNPYNEVTQADIDALRAEVLQYQTYAIGMIRYRADENASWEYMDLTVQAVPEPTTMIAGALLLLPFGASLLRRMRKA